MRTYFVTIRATITKTYEIETDNPATAESVAHEIFTTEKEPDIDQEYEQTTVNVEQVDVWASKDSLEQA